MTSKREEIKELTATLWVERTARERDQQAQERLRSSRVFSMRLLLGHISETIAKLPNDKIVHANLADCLFVPLTPARHRPGVIRLARLDDGAAMLFTTQEFLADAAHMLTVPDNGAPSHVCRFVAVDFQAASSGNPIRLEGADQIAGHELVANAVHYGAGALAVEAATGWQHAITSPATLNIRPPQEQTSA